MTEVKYTPITVEQDFYADMLRSILLSRKLRTLPHSWASEMEGVTITALQYAQGNVSLEKVAPYIVRFLREYLKAAWPDESTPMHAITADVLNWYESYGRNIVRRSPLKKDIDGEALRIAVAHGLQITFNDKERSIHVMGIIRAAGPNGLDRHPTATRSWSQVKDRMTAVREAIDAVVEESLAYEMNEFLQNNPEGPEESVDDEA